MCKHKIILITLLSVISPGLMAVSLSGSIGYGQFPTVHDQSLVVSPYVNNFFTHSLSHGAISYQLSAKKQHDINRGWLHHMMLGPSLSIQKLTSSGQIWELGSPLFYNYQYEIRGHQYDVLLEGDVYFKSSFAQWKPFLTLGLGVGIPTIHYHDNALSGIPINSEWRLSTSSVKAVYELGAGFALPMNEHWAMNFRYAYFYRGRAKLNLIHDQDFNFSLNNQSVFLGVSYVV